MIGAVTYTGIWASRSEEFEYFTSALFPFLVDDALSIELVKAQPSVLWENPNDDVGISSPSVVSGTLVTSINYVTYNNGAIEDLGIQLPAAISGTLVSTINYVTYNDGAVEDIGIQAPAALSGTLVTTINYVIYNTGAIEDVGIQAPSIISGTLV